VPRPKLTEVGSPEVPAPPTPWRPRYGVDTGQTRVMIYLTHLGKVGDPLSQNVVWCFTVRGGLGGSLGVAATFKAPRMQYADVETAPPQGLLGLLSLVVGFGVRIDLQ